MRRYSRVSRHLARMAALLIGLGLGLAAYAQTPPLEDCRSPWGADDQRGATGSPGNPLAVR